MRILVDTNVILDVLCDRKAFVVDSLKVFKYCEANIITGYISALSIPNIMYIMRRELDAESAKKILNSLNTIFLIADLRETDLQKAADLSFNNYEDAVQSAGASRIKADYIVTRNTKAFKTSVVPAITPAELFKLI